MTGEGYTNGHADSHSIRARRGTVKRAKKLKKPTNLAMHSYQREILNSALCLEGSILNSGEKVLFCTWFVQGISCSNLFHCLRFPTHKFSSHKWPMKNLKFDPVARAVAYNPPEPRRTVSQKLYELILMAKAIFTIPELNHRYHG
ncbi:hypothetical protein VNO77_19347 [Canavalia gladiata]|uniref:Uncharacterized protein n=1 Tax=Canavalia gladiata TaxID=3824 RepID=A0AAN9QPI6_CANGL